MVGTFGIYRVAFRLTGIPALLRNTNWITREASWLAGTPGCVQLVAEYEEDAFGTPVPVSTRIVIELSADDCDDAVAKAVPVADTICRIMAFLAGAPHSDPKVISLLEATPGIAERAYQQWNYDVAGLTPSRALPMPMVEEVIQALGNREDRERDAVIRAIKWYTDGLKEVDSIDRFLKLWVALESAGSIINRRAHKSGWRNCTKCQGEMPDREKDEKQERGIRHVFSHVAGAPANAFDQLQLARNKLVHAEWPLVRVRAIVDPMLTFTTEAAIKSILTALPHPDAPPGSKSALVPTQEPLTVADVRISATLPLPDADLLGQLTEIFAVNTVIRSSHMEEHAYRVDAAFELDCELPCEPKDLSLDSDRTYEDSIQVSVDRHPEYSHVEKLKRKR